MGSVALRAPARRARQCHWSLKPRPASSVDTSRTWASPCNAYEFLTAKSRRPDPVPVRANHVRESAKKDPCLRLTKAAISKVFPLLLRTGGGCSGGGLRHGHRSLLAGQGPVRAAPFRGRCRS